MKTDPNQALKDSATTWLCILFSVLWMAVGIGIFVFSLEYEKDFPSIYYKGPASLPLVLLSGLVFTRGAFVFVRSFIYIFRAR